MSVKPSPKRRSPGSKESEFLRPKVIQAVGVGGVIATALFWSVTGRLEPLLLSMFGGMWTYGGLLGLRQDAKEPPPDPKGESSPDGDTA